MLEKMYMLYASDLESNSSVAPGGINSCVINTIRHVPAEVNLEAWGTSLSSETETEVRPAGSRTYLFRSICKADRLVGRRIPLNLRYMLALRKTSSIHPFTKSKQQILFAHRMEYVPALTFGQVRELPPIVMFIHSTSEYATKEMPEWKSAAYRYLEQLSLAHSSAVILVSKAATDYYKSRFPHHAHKLLHVPNPVDTSHFKPQPKRQSRIQLGIPEEAPVYCYHGRMDPEKGVYLLLETFAEIKRRLPEAHLLLVGDGRDRAGMARQIVAMGLSNVHQMGQVPHHEINRYVCCADVSLLTSRFEGMSLGVLESLACGVPVVATAVGDNPFLIQEGITGETVAQHAPEALAAAALRVLPTSSSLAQNCVSMAQQYSPEAHMKQLMEISQACLEPPGV